MIDTYKKQQKKLKVGDKIVIHPNFFKSFESHCDNENEIPIHNSGIVINIILNRDSEYKYIPAFNGDLIKIKLSDGTFIELFDDDIIKIY